MRRRPAGPIVVLASGGLDSLALLGELSARGREVHPLYVRCGYVWERAEEGRLKRQLRALRAARPSLRPLATIDAAALAPRGPRWSRGGRGAPGAGTPGESVRLAGRNFILLACAAARALEVGARDLALGTLKGNPFADATPAFRRGMEAVLSASFGRRFRVLAPYAGVTKPRALARGGEGLPWRLAISCLRPRSGRACGDCHKCEELGAALASL